MSLGDCLNCVSLLGEYKGAVKCRSELEESEEGRLLGVGLPLGRRCTRGGGGGLKEGGDSEVDLLSS